MLQVDAVDFAHGLGTEASGCGMWSTGEDQAPRGRLISSAAIFSCFLRHLATQADSSLFPSPHFQDRRQKPSSSTSPTFSSLFVKSKSVAASGDHGDRNESRNRCSGDLTHAEGQSTNYY